MFCSNFASAAKRWGCYPMHPTINWTCVMTGHAPDLPNDRELAAVVRQFGRARVLVVGDVILDRYRIGDAHRLSRIRFDRYRALLQLFLAGYRQRRWASQRCATIC